MTKTLEFYAIFTIKRLVIRIFLYFKLPQVQKKIKRIVLTSVSLSAYMFAKKIIFTLYSSRTWPPKTSRRHFYSEGSGAGDVQSFEDKVVVNDDVMLAIWHDGFCHTAGGNQFRCFVCLGVR